MPRLVAILLLLAVSAHAGSPLSVDHIPAVEKPADHFYGAIADENSSVAARWELSPAAVPLGGSFTLTLVVSNAANPHELVRPPLRDISDFNELFSGIEDLPDDPADRTADVRFRYKLTPRNVGVKFAVPELEFSYYKPSAPKRNRTQTTFAVAVPFTVTKAKEPTTPTVPLDYPEEYFELRTGGTFARSGGPGWGWWVGLVMVGAMSVMVWVIGWRVMFPDAARLARIRRNKAVRTALDRLKRADTAEQIAITLRNYLIARWGLAFTAQTPAEVAAGLAEVGVPAECAAEAEALLRDCDAARFAGRSDTGVSASRAAEMIQRWEGV